MVVSSRYPLFLSPRRQQANDRFVGASNEMQAFPLFGRETHPVLARIPPVRPVAAIAVGIHAGFDLKLRMAHAARWHCPA
jgi:hypothetical protein